jgi:glutamate 5-kinase
MTNIIIVKIGTESLVDFEDSEKIKRLIDAIADKNREWIHILLVTSGAVDFWRKTRWVIKSQSENKPLLAAIWWDSLMQSYRQKFAEKSTDIAGFLVTHADIEDQSDRRDVFKRTIESAWEQWIIPIINENDALSFEELEALKRWADNDKNALLLARVFWAKQLLFITNTNGVYEDKNMPSTRIARMNYSELTKEKIGILCPLDAKSSTGTGGMASKLSIAYEAWTAWINTHIGDGIVSGLHDISSGGTNILGSL